jgi:cyanate permease
MISLSYSFPTLLEQLILPYGFNSEDASVLGILYNLFGILGGIILSLYLRKRRNFGTMQIIIIILTCVTFAAIWFLLADYGSSKAYWLIFIAIIINGTINISIYSSCFEYAVSLNNYGESLNAGCINFLANTLGGLQIIMF